MLSKVTGSYPKICPVIGVTNLHIFLGTNFCSPSFELPDEVLSGRQPQNKSNLSNFAFVEGLSNIYVSGQTN